MASTLPALRLLGGLAFRYENVKVVDDMYIFAPGGKLYVDASNGFMADQLLLGSSCPLRAMRQSVDDHLALGLRESVLEKVMGGNALQLLKLPNSRRGDDSFDRSDRVSKSAELQAGGLGPLGARSLNLTSLLPTSSWPRALVSLVLLAGFSAMVAAQSSDPTPRERSSAQGHYKVFHDFHYKDGGARSGGGPSQYLSLGSDGAMYGTTDSSGDSSRPNNGSMYRVAPDGTVSTVLQFDAATGVNPYSGNQPGYDGAVYGSLYDEGPLGGGTLYRLHPVEGFSVIHAFDYADLVFGSRPKRVVPMPDGSIIGTTSKVTYKRAPDGTMTVLYPVPLELNLLGTDGNLYGAYLDTAFRLSPQGEYTVLHTFEASSPEGTGTYRLIQARDGNFYGTTIYGGALDSGTAYRMTPEGTVTVLHAFTKQPCGTGSLCYANPFVSLHASDGLLYGTTSSGFQGPNGSIWRMALDGSGFRSLLEFSLEGGDALGAGFLVETPSRALVASSGSGGRFNAGTLFVLKPRAAAPR